MKNKILSIVVTAMSILFVVDISIDQLTGYSILNSLLKLFGVSAGIRSVPFLIRLIIVIVVIILIFKYDRIFDFSFRDEQDQKYK